MGYTQQVKFRGIVASAKTIKLITPRNFLCLWYGTYLLFTKKQNSQRGNLIPSEIHAMLYLAVVLYVSPVFLYLLLVF